jgi:hypothetical protein
VVERIIYELEVLLNVLYRSSMSVTAKTPRTDELRQQSDFLRAIEDQRIRDVTR